MHYMYIAKAICYDGGFDTSIGILGQAIIQYKLQIPQLVTRFTLYYIENQRLYQITEFDLR